MQPEHFPEETNVLAKSQPQYRPLPVMIKHNDEKQAESFTCKYSLSEFEIALINQTKSFYITQAGQFFHPILPQIENPWRFFIISYKVLGSGLFDAFVPMTNGGSYKIEAETPKEIIEEITHYFPECNAGNLIFVEAPSMAISKDGTIEEL